MNKDMILAVLEEILDEEKELKETTTITIKHHGDECYEIDVESDEAPAEEETDALKEVKAALDETMNMKRHNVVEKLAEICMTLNSLGDISDNLLMTLNKTCELGSKVCDFKYKVTVERL